MKTIEKAFNIANLVIMGVCIFPIIFLGWLLFIPAYGMAITNYVLSKGKTYQNITLLVMILILTGLIPIIGYFTRLVAIGFIILLISKHWND